MRIDNLFQYGTYRLVFPLTVNGASVLDIIDAKFIIYDNKNEVIEFDLSSSNVSFSDGKLYIILDSVNTINLTTNYTYEVWVKLSDNKPYIVRSGTIQFNKTKARF